MSSDVSVCGSTPRRRRARRDLEQPRLRRCAGIDEPVARRKRLGKGLRGEVGGGLRTPGAAHEVAEHAVDVAVIQLTEQIDFGARTNKQLGVARLSGLVHTPPLCHRRQFCYTASLFPRTGLR